MLDLRRTCAIVSTCTAAEAELGAGSGAEDSCSSNEGQRGLVKPENRERARRASLSKPAINSSYLKIYSVTCMNSVIMQTVALVILLLLTLQKHLAEDTGLRTCDGSQQNNRVAVAQRLATCHMPSPVRKSLAIFRMRETKVQCRRGYSAARFSFL